MRLITDDPDVEKLVTKRQLSDVLSIHPRSITRLMAEGKIPFIRIGEKSVRFRISEVLAALESDHETA